MNENVNVMDTDKSGFTNGNNAEKRYMTIDIEKFTKIGNNELQKGNVAKSIEAFELAFRRSVLSDDSFTERACAFNLGAVYIAANKPERGLEYLQRAVPPLNGHDGKSNGDLFYNFALGYELLKNTPGMVRYLELAFEQYKTENGNYAMESTVASRLAREYARIDDNQNAAKYYGISADLYKELPSAEEDMVNALNLQTKLLAKIGDLESCRRQLDRCMASVALLKEPEKQGKVYNDLGLTYTQCGEFEKACQSFELALPLSRGSSGDRKREAVLLQNIGAIYNSLGDYQKAVEMHEKAIELHGEQHSRASQGQCFINLAFAYSQLGDEDQAGESYLHALQAAKDSGDFKSQWQSLEGLGAVAFNRGNIDKSIAYFKQALGVMAKGKHDNIAQDRIVTKLTDALQHKVMRKIPARKQSRTIYSDGDRPRRNSRPLASAAAENGNQSNIPLYINDLKRSISKEVENSNLRRRSRSGSIEHYYLGLSEYDSDTDLSLKNLVKKSLRRSKKVEPIDETDLAVDRVTRMKSKPNGTHGHRYGKRRVLEGDSFRKRAGGRKQLLLVKNHPEAMVDWKIEQKNQDGLKQKEIDRALRRLDNSMTSTSGEKVPKNVAAYAALMERQDSEGSSSTNSESVPSTSRASRDRDPERRSVDDTDSESTETRTPTSQSESEMDGPESPVRKVETPAVAQQPSQPASSPTREIGIKNRRPLTAVKRRPIGTSGSSVPDETTEKQMNQTPRDAEPYYEQINDSSEPEGDASKQPNDDEPIYATIKLTQEIKNFKDEARNGEMGKDSRSQSETATTDSDSDSETVTGSSYSSSSIADSVVKNSDKEPLVSTYEKPIATTSSEKSNKSPHYFRTDDNKYARLDKRGRSKLAVDDDEGIYASIDFNNKASSGTGNSGPPRPHESDLSNLTRAEREKVLFEYQKMRNEEDGVVDDVRNNRSRRKNRSRMCLLM
ncbi:uncharacterized protein LOC141906154 [Tubulanus polymorphus]|uniref:uncharacterized protein LOC141906154 n=1 Tax=Tubulanus polymorphus TaxID=672921 RepID=UPI003DA560C2